MIKNESAASLSDERYVSPDDSQAKYFRVLRCCIAILTKLVDRRYGSSQLAEGSKASKKSSSSDITEKYSDIIGYSKLWKLAHASDVSVSRAVLELISSLVKDKGAHELVEPVLEDIATNVVYKSLKSSEPLVATSLLQALIGLTRKYANVWQLANSKKSTSFSALCKFVSQGSRRSSVYFWPSLLALVTALPTDISPYSNSENRDALLKAVSEGVTKETALSNYHAWGAYLTIVEKSVVAQEDSHHIIETAFTNLFNSVVIVTRPTRISQELVQVTSKKLVKFCSLDWDQVSRSLKACIDEIVKRQSRESLTNFTLITSATASDTALKQQFSELLSSIIIALLDKLEKGLNVFEVHLVSTLLVSYEKVLFPDSILSQRLDSFLVDHLPSFIVSEASSNLVAILEIYAKHRVSNGNSSLQPVLEQSFTCIIKSSYEDRKLDYLAGLLKSFTSLKTIVAPIDAVSQYLRYLLHISPGNDTDALWTAILYGICSHGVFVSEEAANDALNYLTITDGPPSRRTMQVFERLLADDNQYFAQFISSPKGKQFVSYLWTIEQSSTVEKLLHSIESPTTGNFEVLCEGLLEEVQHNRIMENIPLLVERGQRLLESVQQTGATSSADSLKQLLFSESDVIEKHLNSIFDAKVSSDLAVADSLGGAVLLVSSGEEAESASFGVNIEQFASTAVYVKSLVIENKADFLKLPASTVQDIILFLLYASEVISSAVFLGKLTAEGDDSASLLDFGSEVSTLLSEESTDFSVPQFVEAISEGDRGLVSRLVNLLWSSSSELTTKGYFSSRVLANIFDLVLVKAADSDVEPTIPKLRILFKTSILGTTAILHGLQKYLLQFAALGNLRNQFASDLIGLNEKQFSQTGLKSLIYLNMLLDVPANDVSTELIPLNRLLMVLQSVFTRINNTETDSLLNSRIELTKLVPKLMSLYPSLPTVFGIWKSCIQLLEQNFIDMSESLALRYFTFRFVVVAQKVIDSTPELAEEFDYSGEPEEAYRFIYEELFDQLYAAEASTNQPDYLTIVQLQKAVLSVPTKLLDYNKLYGLLGTPSSDVQRIAFVLLHRQIPSLQEEKSISFELQKSSISKQNESEIDEDEDEEVEDAAGRFPPRLLKMVKNVPAVYETDHSMTGYLWAWQLVYDHFQNSSYDLRRAYIGQLRRDADNVVDLLLDLISYYIVGNDLNKIAEKSKELDNIDKYEGTLVEDINDEVELLLLRSYFVVLQYTGSLAKSWFLSVKKRSVIIAVEKFTEKYVSPVLITRELNTIEKSLDGNSSINDENMSAKIARATNEVKAYYTTDDQTMEIAIRMPPLYPLRDLQVEGIKRIGVREKQWRAWLLASQAIGTAQNGSIIDSLELFKRNVSMHFEGIVECAICYSILHEDHSLPNKTCTTCKNKFHADCLYKWFKSAGSSSCPLCRATFSFRHGIN
ncbi:ubiquitin-protein ligase RKR1 [Sugiyamaella lignohabitans]|uniref:E3 ubiquitin-protein ligase listerin n=1 Tax=Sugiyamaella lignohabitans TaxID=796027 RepID=A0A167F511_9ASCO|nr:ubiquitin-protein ligase RKR1 [Sugiyamaella lignohabitans]ANB14836.1 ubiquitin-protein ligase RKR1 [Sugiyamaella lignohabitans]